MSDKIEEKGSVQKIEKAKKQQATQETKVWKSPIREKLGDCFIQPPGVNK